MDKKIELVGTDNEGDPYEETASCRVLGVTAGHFTVNRCGASDEAWEAVKERLLGDPDETPAPDGYWDVDGEYLIAPSGHFAVYLGNKSDRLAASLRRQLRAGARALDAPDLPEGVERHGDGTLWARGAVAEGLRGQGWDVLTAWGHQPLAAHLISQAFYEVRPPVAPATERVAWHEARGGVLLNNLVIEAVRWTRTTPEYRAGGLWHFAADDGTVEVLTEDGAR